jgi:hypothetical protein
VGKAGDEFWEAYRDPRWQRKRLAVMEAAGFACEQCGTTDKTLNVHHRHYTKGAKPWEYADDELRCLCERCHEYRTRCDAELRKLSGMLAGGIEFDRVLFYIAGLLMQRCNDSPIDRAVIDTKGYAHGLADAYQLGSRGHELILAVMGADRVVSHDDLKRLRAAVLPTPQHHPAAESVVSARTADSRV